MKINRSLEKIAHLYSSQPFYVQIILTLVFYGLLLLRFLVQQLQKVLHTLQILITKLEHIPYFRTLYKPFIFFSKGVSGLSNRLQQLAHDRFSRKKPKKSLKRPVRPSLAPILTFRHKIKYALIGAIFSFVFIFLPLLLLIFLQNLPNPHVLTLADSDQTTKIYDRNGTFLYQIYATQNRTVIPLSDVPQNLQNATLAIEDKNFYKHPGFDVTSILRAFKEDIGGKSFQGGSTITQQLIKTTFFTNEPSIVRKIKEIVLAFWTERIYTKKQILSMYFNQVPYGGTAWGVEAAADVYFGKHAKDLDLAESAFLAGMTAAPSNYSPFGPNPSLWKVRQKEVLGRMVALNYITQKQADTAAKELLYFKTQEAPTRAPYFVNYIRDYLINKYGLAMVEKGGLQVRTSLDLKTETMAEQVVSKEVANDAPLQISNGAALITDPNNGDILAMVGGHDFNDPNGGNVNLATSLRQPGSSVKVITYSAAMEKGMTAATMIDDSPVNFGGYAPVNYDGKFHGSVPMRVALANSFNIPAVKTLNQIGVPAMVAVAKKMGISSWNDPKDYGLSLTLGAAEVTMLDMAEVYGTLAHHGDRVDLNPILEITDSQGNVIEQKTNTPGVQVLDPGIAYIMSDILADNSSRTLEFGPNSPLYIPNHYVSVKTGTTDNKHDNWTDGYTDKYVVITWVGNNDNTAMSQNLASGITGAAPIWHDIMTKLVTQHPETRQPEPAELTQRVCFGHTEYFISGTENQPGCTNGPVPTTYSVRPQ